MRTQLAVAAMAIEQIYLHKLTLYSALATPLHHRGYANIEYRNTNQYSFTILFFSRNLYHMLLLIPRFVTRLLRRKFSQYINNPLYGYVSIIFN